MHDPRTSQQVSIFHRCISIDLLKELFLSVSLFYCMIFFVTSILLDITLQVDT